MHVTKLEKFFFMSRFNPYFIKRIRVQTTKADDIVLRYHRRLLMRGFWTVWRKICTRQMSSGSIFPTIFHSLIDVSLHLINHLVKEIRYLGLVSLHHMHGQSHVRAPY